MFLFLFGSYLIAAKVLLVLFFKEKYRRDFYSSVTYFTSLRNLRSYQKYLLLQKRNLTRLHPFLLYYIFLLSVRNRSKPCCLCFAMESSRAAAFFRIFLGMFSFVFSVRSTTWTPERLWNETNSHFAWQT